MIFQIIRIVAGFILVLFLPGWLLSFILLKKLAQVERFVLGVGLSIALTMILGFLLTGIGYLFGVKGITTWSVWISLSLCCVIFGAIIFVKGRL